MTNIRIRHITYEYEDEYEDDDAYDGYDNTVHADEYTYEDAYYDEKDKVEVDV